MKQIASPHRASGRSLGLANGCLGIDSLLVVFRASPGVNEMLSYVLLCGGLQGVPVSKSGQLCIIVS